MSSTAATDEASCAFVIRASKATQPQTRHILHGPWPCQTHAYGLETSTTWSHDPYSTPSHEPTTVICTLSVLSSRLPARLSENSESAFRNRMLCCCCAAAVLQCPRSTASTRTVERLHRADGIHKLGVKLGRVRVGCELSLCTCPALPRRILSSARLTLDKSSVLRACGGQVCDVAFNAHVTRR